MLRRLDCRDVARQVFQGRAKRAARLPKNPPVLLVGFPIIHFAAIRPTMLVLAFLHGHKDVLVNLWKTLANLVRFQPEEIDHHDATRRASQIAAIAVEPDMVFQSRPPAKAQVLRFGASDDKARSHQLHSARR